jgi:hypothetical protein
VMADPEEARRLAEFQQAMDHRFDSGENADLILETDDPVLKAAVRLVNEFGGWHEITIEPSAEFLAVIQICQEEVFTALSDCREALNGALESAQAETEAWKNEHARAKAVELSEEEVELICNALCVYADANAGTYGAFVCNHLIADFERQRRVL